MAALQHAGGMGLPFMNKNSLHYMGTAANPSEHVAKRQTLRRDMAWDLWWGQFVASWWTGVTHVL